MSIRPEAFTVEFLAQLLVSGGLLTDKQAAQCVAAEASVRARLEKSWVERGSAKKVHYRASPAEIIAHLNFDAPTGKSVDEDRIMRVVALHASVPYKKIDPLELNAKLIVSTMSRAYARRHVCLPLERKGAQIVVALDNPYDEGLIQTLRDVTGHEIQVTVSAKSDILKSITEVYGFGRAVNSAAQELTGGPDIGNLEQFVRLKSVDDIEATDKHIVNAVDYILHYAFDQRASDIHLEPKREKSLVRMRIDGELHDVYTIPKVVHGAVASRIKMLARMDIAERRRPQDGRIKTERDGREVELRVSSLPVAHGEKLVLRIFDPQLLLQDVRALGFQSDDLETWESFIRSPTGMILVTGPTGSGKTTTLYSTLNELAEARVNVTTIEDPIEMIFEQFNQVMVQRRIDLDFAAALRTILRQDPDIIMVGEIRDSETAKMAVQAALTGHLVLATLHTNDAPSAIMRLRDLGVEPYKIASVVVGVMAQRLLRKVCDQCRVDDQLSPDEIEILDIAIPPGTRAQLPVAHGTGCVQCRGTGHYGRVGVFELMAMTPSLRRLVKADASAEDLAEGARADGMRSLREGAIRMMAQGVTSFEEVARMLGEMI